ncbi:unnamed protein product [Lactuca saligna]|uniref:Protein FAR1-RELATED SEQUENCE n=1 Tax=Lactuca saligna TaxID=75948 RepID=A0AA35Z034_LACSI|nr:unnamed protein product [Lactuca saligna]
MTTSGRSKSIHSFFDEFVNSKTMLNEFVAQYDKALKSRRAVEEDEYFKTINSKAVLSSVHPIEVRAGECYTRKIFEIFQKEWIEANNNLTHETKRHVQTLPDHYILPRWTLDARFQVGTSSIGLDEMNNEKEVSALTLWYVRANSTKAIELAKNSPSKIRRLNNLLVKFLEDEVIHNKLNALENPSQYFCTGISQVDIMPQLSIRDPLVLTNTKGRPKNASRIKSSLEMAKKKRTCSHCKGFGH